MISTGSYTTLARLRWIEALPWAAALFFFFLAPESLSFGARIVIYILFALSLDIILGYGGIATLGHAAFFGFGGYTAGIASAALGITEPFSQIALAAAAAGLLGLASGAVVLRTHGLTLLMLTLAFTALLAEIANRAVWLTGGADGLSGVTIAPVFGIFRFDLYGRTAYLYSLGFLFAVWALVRHIVHAPFGVMLVGIRENRLRMGAIGAPVQRRLLFAYVLSAALAGVAGGLMTQVNQFVGLNALSFELSGEILIMLVLGGVGRIYGSFAGPIVYLVAQDQLAKEFPEYWYLGVGILIIAVVLFARGGVLGIVDKLFPRIGT